MQFTANCRPGRVGPIVLGLTAVVGVRQGQEMPLRRSTVEWTAKIQPTNTILVRQVRIFLNMCRVPSPQMQKMALSLSQTKLRKKF